MRTAFIVTLLLLTANFSLNAAETDAPAMQGVHFGQSYLTPTWGIEEFAKVRGHNYEATPVVSAGVRIETILRFNIGLKKYTQADDTSKMKRYDVLSLTPYYDDPKYENNREAFARLYRMALEQNPNVKAYVATHWPHRIVDPPYESHEAWMADWEKKFEQFANYANEQLGRSDNPNRMRVVPRGQAFMSLYHRGEEGQIPGLRGMPDAWHDSGHPSVYAGYMFACMEYAYIYDESPIGLPNFIGPRPEHRGHRDYHYVDLTDEQALCLQKLAWHHLVTDEDTGMTLPADDRTPSIPTKLQALAPNHQAVMLSWSGSEDEAVGVFEYLIRRNDGREFRALLPEITDRQIVEGGAYRYQVAAIDFAGNISEFCGEISVEVPRDTAAPKVVAIKADKKADLLEVVFSEPVDGKTATRMENYTLEGPAIKSVLPGYEPHNVRLITEPLTRGNSYELTVRGVKDMAMTPNQMDEQTVQFTSEPIEWVKTDADTWDNTEITLEGDQVSITTQGQGRSKGFSGHGGLKYEYAALTRAVRGDFDFVIALSSQSKTGAQALSGIFLAENPADLSDGKFATVTAVANGVIMLQVRRELAASQRPQGHNIRNAEFKSDVGLKLPVWLRMKREGKNLTGYFSYSGVSPDDWILIGEVEAPNLAETMQLGVYNMANDKDQKNTAMFVLSPTGSEINFIQE